MGIWLIKMPISGGGGVAWWLCVHLRILFDWVEEVIRNMCYFYHKSGLSGSRVVDGVRDMSVSWATRARDMCSFSYYLLEERCGVGVKVRDEHQVIGRGVWCSMSMGRHQG